MYSVAMISDEVSMLISQPRHGPKLLTSILMLSYIALGTGKKRKKKTTSDKEKCNGTVIQVGIPSQEVRQVGPWPLSSKSKPLAAWLTDTAAAVRSFCLF